MKRFSSASKTRRLAASSLLALSFFLPLLGGTAGLRAAPENEGQVAAREVALELAGAFSNDGYKIRDGHWAGTLQLREPKVITVNLYAGNQYYFTVGMTDKAKKVAVTVYDEVGKVVQDENFFQDPEKSRAAAGVSPVASGPYYVSVQVTDGAAADFCLLYSYK